MTEPKRFHLAIAVADVAASVADYSQRLGQEPEVVIAGAYALWRTPQLNFSIRQTEPEQAGQLRHLGWEDPQAEAFECDRDCNGILWERFTADQQATEILELWPDTQYQPYL
ncbi:hypothetical protein VZH09_12905 [Synechococcus elongatus IITB7]|uniref:hypothetical protein n=1 Tax=Synechococcus elongatus TaxID=32046 RepID=UPI0030D5AD75